MVDNTKKFKVLIADNLDAEGVEILKSSGLVEVDYRKKTPREELLEIIGDFDGLIIRSATKVNAEVIEKASKLKVVIRAGVGVDNIDIPACSQRGIIVMNAPSGNSVSTAEQAIALMFSLARKIPQANASMHQKLWEKSKFGGSQLTGKTIGVIGLGRIGKEVVKRALGLQMNVMGFDPYIPSENLEHLQIELTTVDEILSNADFITVHTPLTETTTNLINHHNLSKLKKGIRLINCARGGIYDESALIEGIKQGIIAGVALDVFSKEPPPPESELYSMDEVILTPHLGASTDEAQLEVAKETASSMVEFVKSGVARNALNYTTLDPNEMGALQPWFLLCEEIGSFAAQVMKNPLRTIQAEFRGEIVTKHLKPLEVALIKGALTPALAEEVNLVNAPIFAKDRGLSVSSDVIESSQHEASRIKLTLSDGSLSKVIVATVDFTGGRIIQIDEFAVEFKPEGYVLYIYNKDIPKVVGELGSLLGDSSINIASLQLGRSSKGGTALTIISVDEPVPNHVLEKIQAKEYIIDSKYIYI